MDYISIAIDGPAGAGKSSVSKAAAKQLGYVYIDTGAMYRAVALYAIEHNINTKSNPEKLISRLDDIDIAIKYFDDAQHVFLNGRDVSGEIRVSEVSAGASAAAAVPEVRKKLVALQQEMAKNDNVIMDGRDICTSVLPNAQVKVFLTASAESRAKRRYKEMCEKGLECDLATIKSEIMQRDKNDCERAESPLRQAQDAVLLDTTELSFDESVEALLALAKGV